MKVLLFFVVALSVTMSAYATPGVEDFPIPTLEQIDCIFKLVEKTVDENPGLEKWQVAFGEAFKVYAENLEKCHTLDDKEKDECLEKLKQKTFIEYDRLLSLLPEKLRSQFDNGFTKCLKTKFFLSKAVTFKGDIIFPITDEQVECGQKVVRKVVKKDPRYILWGIGVKKSVTSLRKKAKKCEPLSKVEQKECYDKINEEVKIEYKRFTNVLPESIREQFADDFINCFQH